jgi:hypothetical protein
MAVNLDDRRVHHGVFHVRVIRNRGEYPLERTCLDPIAEPLEHRVPLAKRRRQIPPRAPRAGDP